MNIKRLGRLASVSSLIWVLSASSAFAEPPAQRIIYVRHYAMIVVGKISKYPFRNARSKDIWLKAVIGCNEAAIDYRIRKGYPSNAPDHVKGAYSFMQDQEGSPEFRDFNQTTIPGDLNNGIPVRYSGEFNWYCNGMWVLHHVGDNN